MKSGLCAVLLCLLMLSSILVDAFVPPVHSSGTLSSFASSTSTSSSSTGSSNFPTVALWSVENDDEVEPNRKRKTRLTRDSSKSSKRFATGEELKNLRLDLESLRHNLQWAEALNDQVRIESLQKAIRNGENRDPDFMYKKSLRLINQAKKMKEASIEEKEALIEKWATVAATARECLPQFNLNGLWVGK